MEIRQLVEYYSLYFGSSLIYIIINKSLNISKLIKLDA